MGYAQIAVTLAALTLGFLTGLLTFKRSLRWCRHCGRTMSCPACGNRDATGHPVPPDARTRRP